MKTLLTILLLLPVCLFGQSMWQLKIPGAKIKSERWYNHDPEKNFWYKDYFEMHYDTTGYNTAFYLGNGKHKRKNIIKMTYDDQGRQLKSYSNGKLNFNYSYTYNSKNDITIVRDSGTKGAQIIRILNPKANVDTFYHEWGSGKISKTIFKYNRQNNTRYATDLDTNGVLTGERFEAFDSQNRMIESVYIKDGVRQSHSITKYKKYGYSVIDSNKFLKGESKVYTATYRYDKLDKHDRPVVISQLINGKYLVVRKVKTEYYD